MRGEPEINRHPTDIPLEAILEALLNPGGWVYRIAGDYGRNDDVAAHAIVGAWKVDERRCINGDFIPNPNFRRTNS